ncbi:MAG: T9SS type A sorting domain-containing protein [Flavobacteriales bacterium]|nr:T9SS type A sorting domain-containing protein [Flavobacteriales bacterium]
MSTPPLTSTAKLAAGMYLVNITAGETVKTERLVIQP